MTEWTNLQRVAPFLTDLTPGWFPYIMKDPHEWQRQSVDQPSKSLSKFVTPMYSSCRVGGRPPVRHQPTPGAIRILYTSSSSPTSSHSEFSPFFTDSLSFTMRAPIPSSNSVSSNQGSTATTCGEDHTTVVQATVFVLENPGSPGAPSRSWPLLMQIRFSYLITASQFEAV